jgi:hypothetical protein
MVAIILIQISSASRSTVTVGAGYIGMLLFTLSPFAVLLVISNKINVTKATGPSRIALFVVATFTCIVTTGTYWRITFYPGSSTDGLVFVVLPIYSLFLIAITYPVLRWLVAWLFQTKRGLQIGLGSIISFALCYALFSMTSAATDYKNTRYYQKRRLTFNIEEAKKKGVLVKELHFKVDSFQGSLDFHPYIEKAFKYGEDTLSFVPVTTTNYPFRLGFNKVFDSGEFVYVLDNELNKFDSSAGSGYHGASGYLVRPLLHDTITLGIRRRDVVLGRIKVWN